MALRRYAFNKRLDPPKNAIHYASRILLRFSSLWVRVTRCASCEYDIIGTVCYCKHYSTTIRLTLARKMVRTLHREISSERFAETPSEHLPDPTLVGKSCCQLNRLTLFSAAGFNNLEINPCHELVTTAKLNSSLYIY